MNFIIADDSTISRKLLKTHLAMCGHSVLYEAFSGEDLVSSALRIKPEFILTDVLMGEYSGIDASKEILNKLPETKILCISSENIFKWIESMQEFGISGYLYKTINCVRLSAAIDHANKGLFYIDKPIIENIKYEISELLAHNDLEALNEIFNEIVKIIGNPNLRNIKITERQKQILEHLVKGYKLEVISINTGVSVRTVTKDLNRLCSILGVNSRNELIAIASKYYIS